MAAGPDWADGDAYVFTTALGRPMDAFTLSRDFRAELRRAGYLRSLARPPAHDGNTAPRGRPRAGNRVRILGHADFSTTADVYAHLTRSIWLGRARRTGSIRRSRRRSPKRRRDRLGYGLNHEAPGVSSGGFRAWMMVGAEQFERSTS